MQDNQQTSTGHGLKDIFISVLRYKFTFIAMILIITTLGVLIFGHMNNKNNLKYSSTFTIQTLLTKNEMTPNGSVLVYTDLIAEENLQKAKELSNLEHLDVEQMRNNGDISIVEFVDLETVKRDWTVTVNAKYFKNRQEAMTFINNLLHVPYYSVSKDLSSDVALSDFKKEFKNALSYESKIAILSKQQSFLLNQYDSLIKQFSDQVYLNNKTLSQHKNDISFYFTNNDLSLLQKELQVMGYAPESQELVNNYQTQKDDLEAKLAVKQATYDELLLRLPNINSNPEMTANLISLISDIENYKAQIANIDKKIEFAKNQGISDTQRQASDNFEAKLDDIREALESFTTTYIDNKMVLSKSLLKPSFASSSIVTVTGSRSYLTVGIVSFVASILISLVVVCLYDLTKKVYDENKNLIKKDKKNKNENA